MSQAFGCASAQRDDRFAQRDDDDRTVALDEIRGYDPKSVGSGYQGTAEVDHRRRDPQQFAVGGGHESCDNDQGRSDEQARNQSADRRRQFSLVSGRPGHEHPGVDEADCEHRERKNKCPGGECGW